MHKDRQECPTATVIFGLLYYRTMKWARGATTITLLTIIAVLILINIQTRLDLLEAERVTEKYLTLKKSQSKAKPAVPFSKEAVFEENRQGVGHDEQRDETRYQHETQGKKNPFPEDDNTVKIERPLAFTQEHLQPQTGDTFNNGNSSSSQPTCRFPQLDPFDPKIIDIIKIYPTITCPDALPSVTYIENGYLKLDWEKIRSKIGSSFAFCRYRDIIRHEENEDGYRMSKWKDPFKDELAIPLEQEFLQVRCVNNDMELVAAAYHTVVRTNPELNYISDIWFRRHLVRDRPKETLNVLLVGVDGTSRMNLIRSMPLTHALLNRMGGVEMKMYNKVGDNTFPNMTPFLTGLYISEHMSYWNFEQHLDSWTFIWDRYREAGYVTQYNEDHPTLATFHYFKKGFSRQPAHFYNRPFLVRMEADEQAWSNDHNCIGDVPETTLHLNYLKEFAREFKDMPHFSYTFMARLTHDDLGLARAGDQLYHDFLTDLKEENLINNTLLVFYSDHGARYGDFRTTYQGMIEERAPFISFVFPEWFRWKYPNIMRTLNTNSERLTTPFDVHETLRDVLYFTGETGKGRVQDRGISLFREIPIERTCEHATVDPHWCLCNGMKSADIPADQLNYLALTLVEKVNSLTEEHREDCVPLDLETITTSLVVTEHNSSRITPDSRSEDSEIKAYRVTVKTTPGHGLYEATLTYDSRRAIVTSDVSRLNRFGNQSHCVEDPKLKLYCFCAYQLD